MLHSLNTVVSWLYNTICTLFFQDNMIKLPLNLVHSMQIDTTYVT